MNITGKFPLNQEIMDAAGVATAIYRRCANAQGNLLTNMQRGDFVAVKVDRFTLNTYVDGFIEAVVEVRRLAEKYTDEKEIESTVFIG